jgi:hypothetical protein
MYDVSLGDWEDSIERRNRRMFFPRGFFDGSIVLIQKLPSHDDTAEFDFWSFLDPFSYGVWLTIVGSILVSSGLVYLLKKLSGRHASGRYKDKSKDDNIYMTREGLKVRVIGGLEIGGGLGLG